MLRVSAIAVLGALDLPNQPRIGGFETVVGFPKPIGLLPLGLFVDSASGAILRLKGDGCGSIGR